MDEKKKIQSNIGGLVGKAIGGKIDNCHVDGKIIINGEQGEYGGLVGSAVNTEITNSTSNVEIIINSENVFTELKREVAQIKELEIQKELLNLIEKMESCKGTRSFKEHYKNFISRSADYMTLLTPFLPKLTEFIQ
ncbi:GLUG motif-containing protein [Lysinibacillus xylanilyticus]|uniref:GLUG motif-containing protein n=1 Tax=Lysinibacillus xylanilyticus TaxID=582475 RepID=UPI003CFD756D